AVNESPPTTAWPPPAQIVGGCPWRPIAARPPPVHVIRTADWESGAAASPLGAGAGGEVVAGCVAVCVETALVVTTCFSACRVSSTAATTPASRSSPEPTSTCGRRPRTVTVPRLAGTPSPRDRGPLHVRAAASRHRQRLRPGRRLHRRGRRQPACAGALPRRPLVARPPDRRPRVRPRTARARGGARRQAGRPAHRSRPAHPRAGRAWRRRARPRRRRLQGDGRQVARARALPRARRPDSGRLAAGSPALRPALPGALEGPRRLRLAQ